MNRKNKIKLDISKLIVLAIVGSVLSIALLFFTAWATNEAVSAAGVYSDHATSVRLRLQEVLFSDAQVWQSIINSQLKIAKNNNSNSIVAAGYVLTGVDLYKPITFLQSQIASLDPGTIPDSSDILDDTVSESAGPLVVNDVVDYGAGQEISLSSTATFNSQDPVVFIYHTHNTEAYMPDSGVRYQENGNSATVVQTGILLAELLQDKYSIPVMHTSKNHIWEPFWAAYSHSLQTVEAALNEQQSINYILDIHNDGVPKELTTTRIKGQKYARLYFVVGSDRIRNPRWEQNYKFALRLQHKIEQRYPGLSRGILLQDTARYNQHLCDNSILVEMGGYQNALIEAKRSTEILAEILAEIVLEDMSKR